MNDKILNKIVELNEALKEIKHSDTCKITFEHPDEAQLIGTENSYLHLLQSITNLMIAKNKSTNENDLIEQYKDGLISYEIKNSIDEFSDCWIVNAQIK